jgi:hypothetical protein
VEAHFCSLAGFFALLRLAGFRHCNRDSLFAAFHLATLKIALFVFVHDLLDLSFLRCARHLFISNPSSYDKIALTISPLKGHDSVFHVAGELIDHEMVNGAGMQSDAIIDGCSVNLLG